MLVPSGTVYQATVKSTLVKHPLGSCRTRTHFQQLQSWFRDEGELILREYAKPQFLIQRKHSKSAAVQGRLSLQEANEREQE